MGVSVFVFFTCSEVIFQFACTGKNQQFTKKQYKR
jgi:hypothetical protein